MQDQNHAERQNKGLSPKIHFDEPQEFWEIILGLKRQKWNVVGRCPFKSGSELAVKHGGGGVMVWLCFLLQNLEGL